jgi:alkylation response protein AidB-like acyl-CoA dehydrogenase
MDFELTKSQKEIQKAAREFAKGEFDKALALEMDKKYEFPTKIWKKACGLGFVGIHFPEKYSGQDLGVLENVIIADEFCARESGIGSAVILSAFASECVLRFGSEELKQRFLPAVAEGKVISGGAFTEPGRGPDISSLDTTAVGDGNEWVINGTKTFITNGGLAGFYCVMCQTDAGCQPSYQGISLILVEADRAGLTVADVGEKLGIHMVATAELNFKNTAQGAYNRALAYVKEREQFGRKIAQFQVTQHKLADMATKIELARLITYKAAWNFDQGRLDPKLTAMAKMYAARTAVEVADEAIQLLGGYGYMAEYEVERFYRDAKITEIYEGTRESQKNTIAGAILGNLR